MYSKKDFLSHVHDDIKRDQLAAYIKCNSHYYLNNLGIFINKLLFIRAN